MEAELGDGGYDDGGDVWTWSRLGYSSRPTLLVTVGSIGAKPGVVDGRIAIRDYLSLTVSFDHEIIDSAPAARFTEHLKELIESGYGLPDSTSRRSWSERKPHPRKAKVVRWAGLSLG